MQSFFTPYSKLMFQLFGSPAGVAAYVHLFVDDFGDYIVMPRGTHWY